MKGRSGDVGWEVKPNSVLNAQQRFAFLCYSWNRVCRVPRFRCVKHPIETTVPTKIVISAKLEIKNIDAT